MSKGGYTGGSTIIRPGSSWFSKPMPKVKKKKRAQKPAKQKPLTIEQKIERAAAKLQRSQEKFDQRKARTARENNAAKQRRLFQSGRSDDSTDG